MVLSCISRPNRRERIETCGHGGGVSPQIASPGLTAGSGLKLGIALAALTDEEASPGLTAGSGLKPCGMLGDASVYAVSLGLNFKTLRSLMALFAAPDLGSVIMSCAIY